MPRTLESSSTTRTVGIRFCRPFRRPAQVQVNKDQRHEQCASDRENEREYFAWAAAFEYIHQVRPGVDPQRERQEAIEPLGVDQALNPLPHRLPLRTIEVEPVPSFTIKLQTPPDSKALVYLVNSRDEADSGVHSVGSRGSDGIERPNHAGGGEVESLLSGDLDRAVPPRLPFAVR